MQFYVFFLMAVACILSMLLSEFIHVHYMDVVKYIKFLAAQVLCKENLVMTLLHGKSRASFSKSCSISV